MTHEVHIDLKNRRVVEIYRPASSRAYYSILDKAKQDQRYRQALRSPSLVYANPSEVVTDTSLNAAEKLRILHSWLEDAYQLQVAEYEGLEGSDYCLADDIKSCLKRIHI